MIDRIVAIITNLCVVAILWLYIYRDGHDLETVIAVCTLAITAQLRVNNTNDHS